MKTLFALILTVVAARAQWSDFAVSGVACPGEIWSHYGTNVLSPPIYRLFSNFTTNATEGDPIPFDYNLVEHRGDGYWPSPAAIVARYPDVCQLHEGFWPTTQWTVVGSNQVAGAFAITNHGNLTGGMCAAVWQAFPNLTTPQIGITKYSEEGPFYRATLRDQAYPPPEIIMPEHPNPPLASQLQALTLPGAGFEVYASDALGSSWTYATNFSTDAFGHGSTEVATGPAARFWKVVCTNLVSQ